MSSIEHNGGSCPTTDQPERKHDTFDARLLASTGVKSNQGSISIFYSSYMAKILKNNKYLTENTVTTYMLFKMEAFHISRATRKAFHIFNNKH